MTKQVIGIARKMKHIITLSLLILFPGISGTAHALPITLPPGLSPDSPYRLAFVTAGLFAASSTDIGVYNSYVTTEATASPELAVLGTEWKVIGSTATVDAKTNTATDPVTNPSVPIYNLAGLRIADSYSDFWDGTLINPINVDQYGVTWAQKVFTGTNTSGGGISDYQLGSNSSRVQYGESQLANSGWTSIDWLGSFTTLHYYAISNVLGQQTSPVPEPTTIFLLGAGLAGLTAAVRRKK